MNPRRDPRRVRNREPCEDDRSRQDRADDLAGDVGQAEVAAGVAVGELLVVEAEGVQDRRVEVVDADPALDGPEAELVGGAVDRGRA